MTNSSQSHGRFPSFSTSRFYKTYIQTNFKRRKPNNSFNQNQLPRVDFSQPVQVGQLSRLADKSWKIGSDDSFKTAKFKYPDIPKNLNEGFEEFCTNYEEIGPESLELILETVKDSDEVKQKKPQVVSWSELIILNFEVR